VQIGICTELSQLGNAVLPRLAGWDEWTAPLRWGCARQRRPALSEGSDLQAGRKSLGRETWESHGGGASGKNPQRMGLSFWPFASHTEMQLVSFSILVPHVT